MFCLFVRLRHAFCETGEGRALGVHCGSLRVVGTLLPLPLGDTWCEKYSGFCRNAHCGQSGTSCGLWLPKGPNLGFATYWGVLGPNGPKTTPLYHHGAGAVAGMAPRPTNANIIYAASVNGGVWKTINAKEKMATWTALTDYSESGLSIGAVALDSTNPDVVVACIGTMSSLARQGSHNNNVLLSTDAGATWTTIVGPESAVGSDGELFTSGCTGIAIDGAIIVLGLESPGDDPAGPGLYYSSNKGTTWTLKQNFRTHQIAKDPNDKNVIYATLSKSGLWKSPDHGATWNQMALSAPMTTLALAAKRIKVAVGKVTSRIAVQILGTTKLTQYSDDAGSTWNTVDTPDIKGDYRMRTLAVNPTNSNLIYIDGETQSCNEGWCAQTHMCDTSLATGSQCVYMNEATGTSSGTSTHADSRAFAWDADNNLLLSNDGGVFKFVNPVQPLTAAGDWISLNGDLANFEVHSFAYNPLDGRLLVGQQDNGVQYQLPSDSRVFQELQGGDGAKITSILYAEGTKWRVFYSSQNLGNVNRMDCVAGNCGRPQAVPLLNKGKAQFYSPIAVHVTNPDRLVVGFEAGFGESTNAGESLTITPVGAAGEPAETRSIIYGHSSDAELLYIVCANGVFFRSTEQALIIRTPPTALFEIASDPSDKLKAAACAKDGKSVLLTADGGATWTAVTGLPGPDFPSFNYHAITYVGANHLAVGARAGVFIASRASGFTNWIKIGKRLPQTTPADMIYVASSDLLIVSTIGRSVWQVKGLSALPNEAAAIPACANADDTFPAGVSKRLRGTRLDTRSLLLCQPDEGGACNADYGDYACCKFPEQKCVAGTCQEQTTSELDQTDPTSDDCKNETRIHLSNREGTFAFTLRLRWCPRNALGDGALPNTRRRSAAPYDCIDDGSISNRTGFNEDLAKRSFGVEYCDNCFGDSQKDCTADESGNEVGSSSSATFLEYTAGTSPYFLPTGTEGLYFGLLAGGGINPQEDTSYCSLKHVSDTPFKQYRLYCSTSTGELQDGEEGGSPGKRRKTRDAFVVTDELVGFATEITGTE